jgi:hypothetical protein
MEALLRCGSLLRWDDAVGKARQIDTMGKPAKNRMPGAVVLIILGLGLVGLVWLVGALV